MELNSFFKDLKIVELSSVLAGPLAGSFFAEIGAHVIKIENKLTTGDITRKWKLPEEDKNQNSSAYYHSANYSKEVLQLDFNNESDIEILKSHIKETDLVITNFLKNTADKLNIGIEKLKEIKNESIIIQLSAYDYDDNIPGFDLVMQAECGFISMNGSVNELAKMPVAMIDILASHQIKEAALIGLIHKIKTGNGSTHYVSLFKSGISALVNQGTNYLMENHIAKPIGTYHPNIAPYGELLETKDNKKIMLAVGTDKQFETLLDVLDLNEYLYAFNQNTIRVVNRTQLLEILNKKSSKMQSEEIMNILKKAAIPFAEIKNIQEVFESEDAKEMVVENSISGYSNGKYIKSIAFKSEFY